MGIRILYRPHEWTVDLFDVWVPDLRRVPGTVRLEADGRWSACPLGASFKSRVRGWVRRSDAARYLVITAGLAREPLPSLWQEAA
jgi:hypothetical protein